MTLADAIAALPIHTIGGYEWECETCHRHWDEWGPCPDCGKGRRGARWGSYDKDGNPCDHAELLDRTRVLALIAEYP